MVVRAAPVTSREKNQRVDCLGSYVGPAFFYQRLEGRILQIQFHWTYWTGGDAFYPRPLVNGNTLALQESTMKLTRLLWRSFHPLWWTTVLNFTHPTERF
jgi:hypothetical protein